MECDGFLSMITSVWRKMRKSSKEKKKKNILLVVLVFKFRNNLNNEPKNHIGVIHTIKLNQFLMIRKYYNEAAL